MIYDDVARAIVENDKLPQSDRLTNVQIAKACGTSEASVRRRRRALRRVAERQDTTDTGSVSTDAFFADIPSEAITSRGKSVRLADGSWEKVTYSPTKAAVIEAQTASYEDIERILLAPRRTSGAPYTKVPDYCDRTLVINVSDLQAGKVDELGGTPEMTRRVLDMYDQIEEFLETSPRYGQIVIADCGDSLEGFGNTTQQQQTNDLSLTDQFRAAQALMVEAVRRFSVYSDDVAYVAVSSNHCAVRTGTGANNRSNAPDDDWGLLMQDNIKMALEGRPEYEHVWFVKPQKWEEAVTVRAADGTVIGFTHGHLAKSQDKMGDWFAGQAFAHRSGLEDAAILVHGHYHNMRLSLTGDNRYVVGLPTADNGSSWFTNTSGQRSKPGMLTFEVANGKVEELKAWYASKELGDING